MMEGLEKNSGTKQGGDRDLSEWSLSKFVGIRSETVAPRDWKTTKSPSIDRLFSSDEARLVWKKFIKYEINPEDVTNMAYLLACVQ